MYPFFFAGECILIFFLARECILFLVVFPPLHFQESVSSIFFLHYEEFKSFFFFGLAHGIGISIVSGPMSYKKEAWQRFGWR